MRKNLRYWAAFALVAVALLGVSAWLFAPAQPTAEPTNPLQANEPALAPDNNAELGEEDAARYRDIFTAQAKGDFKAADSLMAQLENQALLGYVLSQRYTTNRYKATTAELDAWLNNYGDMPGASRMAALVRHGLPKLHGGANPLKGDGYIDHLGRSAMPSGWQLALTHWKNENYREALRLFRNFGENAGLSPWQRAAGYYWAYRAADALEDAATARSTLTQAAQFNTTFYGLLASTKRGGIRLKAEAPEVSDTLREAPAAIRASLLAQLGRAEDAEAELRLLYAKTPEAERKGIITLASEMNLPNLQVRLANTPGLTPAEILFASYPRPSFMEAQQVADPALLMAIARNESAFRADAGSEAGAQGMMQMLPSTARGIERQVDMELAQGNPALDSVIERLNDPVTATRYGAEYVNMLSAQPSIKGNLVRLLAGYNAGPAAVANWRRNDDPLLYIESIPYVETRNYVMQVMAQYWIYQSIAGETPATLAALTQGEWPQV